MSIEQHINVTVKVNNAGVPKQGFGTIGILTYKTVFPEASRSYRSLAAAITDGFPVDSPEGISLARIFGQSPHPPIVKLLKGALPPTQQYRIDIDAVALGRKYALEVSGEGVTDTTVEYQTLADLTFVDADVNTGTDLIAKALHGMTTGAGPYRLSNAGGALPSGTGLAADTDVWIYAPTTGTFGFATSKANALSATLINITSASGGGTHTIRRNQNDVIAAQLVQGLNAVTGKNYTAVQTPGGGETDYVVVTATAPGNWFSLKVVDGQYDNLNITQNHADPGIQTDLNNIVLADKDWYWLHTMYNSEDMAKKAAEWTEAQKFKMYFFDTCDTAVEDTAAGNGDVGDDLENLSYRRTLPIFKRDPSEMFAAGLMSLLAGKTVGTWTAAYKTVTGCTADNFTDTQMTNLDAKKVSYYKEEATVPFLWEGKVGNAEYGFADVTVSLDFVLDDIQKSAFAVVKALDKVSYDDEDIAMIRRAIEGALNRAKSNKHKIIAVGTPGDPDDPEPRVTFPFVADIDPTVRALRQLPDGEVSFRLRGAVHTVDVTMNVTF